MQKSHPFGWDFHLLQNFNKRIPDGLDSSRREGAFQPGRIQKFQKVYAWGIQILREAPQSRPGFILFHLIELQCGVVADHLADDVHGTGIEMVDGHKFPVIIARAVEAVALRHLIIKRAQSLRA